MPSKTPLPATARAVIAGTITAAAGVLVVVWLRTPGRFELSRTLLLVAAIALGEALRIVLPVRRGGSVLFTLSEAGLTAGLLLVHPHELVVGAAAGVALGQLPFPAASVKRLFNVAQYTVCAGAAALLFTALHPPMPELQRSVLVPLFFALVLFYVLNAIQVAAVLVTTAGARFAATTRTILASNGVLTTANACVGLLAVALLAGSAWLLPALAAPLLLLYSASRHRVASQLDAERSTALTEVQKRLAEAASPREVAASLVAGTDQVLGMQAAVTLDGRRIDGQSSAVPASAEVETAGRALLHVWAPGGGGSAGTSAWLARLGELGGVALERTESRTVLEQEREMLRAVVDGSGDGIYVLGPDDDVTEWNPAMSRLSGVSAAGAIGARVDDVLGSGPWCSAGYHDVLRVAEGPHNEVVWRVAVTSVSEAGRTLRIGVVHDVTAERRAARTKDDMLAIVSHELRSPLTPIKAGAVTLLRRWERLRDDQRRYLLQQIGHQADHLARLVDDLLLVGQSLANGDARPTLELVPVDLTEQCRTIVGDSAARHVAHDLRLVVDEPADRGLPAVSDPGRLRQVLTNLLDNACKYSEPGTTVTVSLAAEGDYAVVVVDDEGRGIPAGDLDRVFERFERIDAPDFMTTSGAGLGLHIVQGLVAALGGTVSLESRVGVGTTVTLRLPLHPAAEPALDGSASAGA